jgi:hypothetical protein
MKADSVIDNDEAQYLTDAIMETIDKSYDAIFSVSDLIVVILITAFSCFCLYSVFIK